jgi:ABC-2 type transport system permease protein
VTAISADGSARAELDATSGPGSGWLVLAQRECRELWVGGRGPVLVFVFSILLSCISYLAATNQVLNFLEQREAVDLTVRVAMAVGVLVTLVVSADAISGERERGTLETLLLAPVSRRGIVVAKLVGALSLWLAAWVVSAPYVWALGHGVSLVGQAILLSLLVGTILALALASVGTLVSALSGSNKVSISVSLLILVAMSAPTELPTGLANTWLGDALVRINPIGSALHYTSAVLVSGHHWTVDLDYLASPLLTAVVVGGALLVLSPRIVRVTAGGSKE